MSFPVRLRHPRGVTTLTLDPSTTYDTLQSLIFSATEIPLDAQDRTPCLSSLPLLPGSRCYTPR